MQKAGIDGADEIARATLADEDRALARLAIARRIRAALDRAKDLEELARGVAQALVAGEDESLTGSWRLVDGMGRPLGSLELSRRTG